MVLVRRRNSRDPAKPGQRQTAQIDALAIRKRGGVMPRTLAGWQLALAHPDTADFAAQDLAAAAHVLSNPVGHAIEVAPGGSLIRIDRDLFVDLGIVVHNGRCIELGIRGTNLWHSIRQRFLLLHEGSGPAMDVREGFIGSVGGTPLIRLSRLSNETGCEILAKAEFLNPGGSVKDRAALYIIRDAERRGQLKPGGTVVEGTAGNTGIGLAHICAARGYRCVIVIPETQSPEKMELLRTLGAQVRPVPAVPYRDANNYQKLAGRLAAQTPNAIWANQFDNLVNRQAHYETTGPEIWQQAAGRVDAFVCATGTGGTLAGVARYLKEKNPQVHIVLADPHGSALYSYVKTGQLIAEGRSITEGIGTTRITTNLADTPIDDAVRIDDQTCVSMVYRLLREEGLFVGGSTGINVAAAVAVARQLGKGHVIVTLLCDRGSLYAARLFNTDWLKQNGLDPAA
jgi:cysteine synthase A